jgi:hypothetical protein
MKSNLLRRIQDLEKGLVSQPTVLLMADGAAVTINGKGDYVASLLGSACNGKHGSPKHLQTLELIRQSVSSNESGGGQLIELTRALLLSPMEPFSASS